MFEQVKPTVLLDCVGGKYGSDILRMMAPKSTLITYGSLTDEPYDLSFTPKEKFEYDYNMVSMNYFTKHPMVRQIYNGKISEAVLDGKLKVFISKKFKQKDFKEAIEYYKQNSSQGKVILQP